MFSGTAIPHDAVLYHQRHKIENMFGRFKDWRPIHTSYDQCAYTFMSAICIAATVIFWLDLKYRSAEEDGQGEDDVQFPRSSKIRTETRSRDEWRSR